MFSWGIKKEHWKEMGRHCVKSIRILNFSGPYFSAFGLNPERYSVSIRMRANTDQKKPEHGHFSHSTNFQNKFVSRRLLIRNLWEVSRFFHRFAYDNWPECCKKFNNFRSSQSKQRGNRGQIEITKSLHCLFFVFLIFYLLRF